MDSYTHLKGLLFLLVKILTNFNYVSINFKPDPPGDLQRFGTLPLPGGSGFIPTFLAWRLGFRIREIFYIGRKGTFRFVSKKLEAE